MWLFRKELTYALEHMIYITLILILLRDPFVLKKMLGFAQRPLLARAVLGARGVTFTDLSAWDVYSGNPAKNVKSRTRFERD
jgi:hypothetical protein